MGKIAIGLKNPTLQFDGQYELLANFLEQGDQRPEIGGDVWNHKHCPAEIGLNGDNLEGAGLHYGKEWVEAAREHFGRFEFARIVV